MTDQIIRDNVIHIKSKVDFQKGELVMAAEKNQNTLYLVTGGAGFLGGTVCRQLVDQGHRVRAFMLPNDPAKKFVPEEAEAVEGDLSPPLTLTRKSLM